MSKPGDHATGSYVHINKKGILETVGIISIEYSDDPHLNERSDRVIDISLYERELDALAPVYLDVLKTLGATPPIYLSMVLIGVKDTTLLYPNVDIQETGLINPTSTEPVTVEKAIEQYDDLSATLRSCFDTIANVWGYNESPTFSWSKVSMKDSRLCG